MNERRKSPAGKIDYLAQDLDLVLCLLCGGPMHAERCDVTTPKPFFILKTIQPLTQSKPPAILEHQVYFVLLSSTTAQPGTRSCS